ncbi:PREDICTED: BUD13 homolog [Eufriesea mexicana]|uniref:BUD13 homolog n=1 Tax=Eufriesea mexicana TaxID=516756 RepID=UPI00083BBE19|nr:PREDICTED: BUD13 homolog [Eufriesea mexicana]
MEKKVINQKEYLKKYLSSGDGDDKKKKKKKKMKSGAKTVKIIDDDIDLKNMRPMEENEFDIFINAEDAPQIAGVVDERGPVDFTDKRRWKIIADDEGGDLTVSSIVKETKQFKQVNDISDELSPPRKSKKYSDVDLSPPRISKKTKDKINTKAKRDEDSDLSPPRIKSKNHISSKHKSLQSDSDSDSSQATDVSSHKIKKRTRKNKKACDDSDLSPPRRWTKDYDSDLSPPRKSKKHKSKKGMKHKDINDLKLRPSRKDRKDSDSDINISRRNRKDSDSDMSLFRKNRKDSDSDLSLERKNKTYESDLSPPRKSKKHKHRTKDSDSEFSPPRRKYERDVNVHMSSKRKDRNDESDYSLAWQSKKDRNLYFETKRNKYDNTLKESSPRQHKYRHEKTGKNRIDKHSEMNTWFDKRHYDSDMTPPCKRNRDVDISPNRFRKSDKDFYKNKSGKYNKYDNNKYNHDPRYSHRENSYVKEKKSKYGDINEDNNETRMKKTLDGKTAGLQNARALREETEAYKKREAEHFSKLSKEVTGVGLPAVIRDTKTGRKRNLEAEAIEEREKQKQQAEMDEKYAKWGRGLKQVEDHQEKLKDDLYEMSKPLARYADDVDLDKRLREQEREGDPMLEYIKQKQIKEGKRKPDRPKYEGSFMPNRFGIKPGHRWDGVDRSNGYEKRWFEAQNARVARQEEAYKWSTSDM